MDEFSLLKFIAAVTLAAILLRWIFTPTIKPVRLPVIGHLHLLGHFVHHSLMDLAQKYGPCMVLQLGSIPTLIISSATVAKEALKNHDLVFSSRPVMRIGYILSWERNGILWSPYGVHWRTVRRVCTVELLTLKRVEFFRPIRNHEMKLFVSKMVEHSHRDEVSEVTTMLSDFTYNVMTNMVYGKSLSSGIQDEEAVEYKKLITETFILGGEVLVGDYIPWLSFLDWKKTSRAYAIHKTSDSYLQKQIDEHRQQNKEFNDFLSALIESKEVGTSDTIIKAIIEDIIAGGTDTSAVTVEWALAELLKQPETMSKVQHEIDEVVGTESLVQETDLEKLKYLSAVVKETLRLHPPAPILIYETTEECQLNDCHVPKKCRVLMNVYGIARDASNWTDPLRFYPERFMESDRDVRGQDFEVLPFGAGRRGCPGTQLGLTMVKITLATLIHGFNWKMPKGMTFDELDMSEQMGLTVPRATPLALVPSVRLNFLKS